MISPGLAVLAPSAETAARSASAFMFRSADADLVRRVLSETGVVREPARPSIAGYISAWGEAIARWISDFFSARPELAEGIVSAVELVAIGVVATAAALLIVISSLTGIVTLLALRARRRVGFTVGALGVLTVLAIYLICVPK